MDRHQIESRTEGARGAHLCFSNAGVHSRSGCARRGDLVLYGEPTLERALRSIGTLWQGRRGTRVNVSSHRAIFRMRRSSAAPAAM